MKKTSKLNNVITLSIGSITADQACQKASKRLKAMERDIFNVAIAVAFARGVKIPAYKQGDKVVTPCLQGDPLPVAEVAVKIDRAESMVTDHTVAVQYLIDRGGFDAVAEGQLPYSQGKLCLAARAEDVFSSWTTEDILSSTLDALKKARNNAVTTAALKEEKKAAARAAVQKADKKKQQVSSAIKADEADKSAITLTIDCIQYTVSKKKLLAFLEEAAVFDKHKRDALMYK